MGAKRMDTRMKRLAKLIAWSGRRERLPERLLGAD
jgi:hypothetical protein